MHSSVAGSSFCWLQVFFSGKTGVVIVFKQIMVHIVMLMFITYFKRGCVSLMEDRKWCRIMTVHSVVRSNGLNPTHFVFALMNRGSSQHNMAVYARRIFLHVNLTLKRFEGIHLQSGM